LNVRLAGRFRRNDPDRDPQEFLTYDAAAEFRDSHDTTHYPGVFRTVSVAGGLQRRHYEIEIDADLANTGEPSHPKTTGRGQIKPM